MSSFLSAVCFHRKTGPEFIDMAKCPISDHGLPWLSSPIFQQVEQEIGLIFFLLLPHPIIS